MAPNISEFRNNPIPSAADLAWFNSLDLRSQSEVFNWVITDRAHPCVRAGLDQCFLCGKFGHRYNSCKVKIGAMAFQHWRRATNGISYSMDMFNLTDEALATANSQFEPGILYANLSNENDNDDVTSFILTDEDVSKLDAIEKAAASSASEGQGNVEIVEHLAVVSNFLNPPPPRSKLKVDNMCLHLRLRSQLSMCPILEQIDRKASEDQHEGTSNVERVGGSLVVNPNKSANGDQGAAPRHKHNAGNTCYHCFNRGFAKGRAWSLSGAKRASILKTSICKRKASSERR
ncbi:uncharacterized protein MELLADRAFT_105537 [Melampsora larici-populina 98AG31]|uniref:CCHC-type domain-containing protein n=1 Tax=Melampsora larici-populina (strain 98AG31 / pathotype 3-4-7) TaxID=747676 RepID=F4RIJ6_MELLP|nr:uncharacterized protein MELLADRAFT_105537 [Melampsora larici-populina 98AG31]EGG07578.1 hypothetical protein MELLADRAFT_105537 [Melampsora larici-populina 98AG31]